MSLYRYVKQNAKSYDSEHTKYLDLNPEDANAEDITLWKSVGGSYNFLQNIVNKSKTANVIIPAFFILLGLGFIGKHFLPNIQTWAQEQSGILAQGTASPVAETFIDSSKYISNPAGLDLIAKNAFQQNILQEDTVSNSYRGTFYISIPALGMDRLPVQSNVDSTSESAYNSVLTTKLAHFANTGLPISDVQNNIVIYGHSATSNYGARVSDPIVAFSFLPNLRVGDDIYLEIEGKTYQFKMYKSKIVQPDDLSIINGSKGQRTLTLFTCYPAGNSAQRYVAIARPV